MPSSRSRGLTATSTTSGGPAVRGGAAHGHGLGSVVSLSPSIVAPSSGPELMIVFVRSTDAAIVFTTWSGGAWSSPVAIASAVTNEPVSLIALAGGDVVLAFRGLDSQAYWSRHSSGIWSSVAPIASPNPTVASPPSLAPGVGGVDAELAYVSAGAAYHQRLTGATWSGAVLVGGAGLTAVSIASSP
ncbi:MAG: hypothetical protein M5U28_42595 [Sandaracinaceae bacterium]|nr:hypothetical protein [Sandaracinaceae bacterium]